METVGLLLVQTLYVALAVELQLVAWLFVAVTLNVQLPACAVDGEVTFILVEAVDPGLIVKDVVLNEHVKPVGQLYDKLKVDAPQVDASLFVTLTV